MTLWMTLACAGVLGLAVGCGGGGADDSAGRDRDDEPARSVAGDDDAPAGDGASAEVVQTVEPVDAPPAEPGPRAGWSTYRHALGASLRHPPGWSTQETAMGVALLPGDHRVNEEALVLWGMQLPAGRGGDLLSSESAGQMDALVMQLMPGLSRTGEPRALETAHGPGAVYGYAGSSPDGRRLAAEVYFTAADGVGLGLTVVGLADHVAQRSADAELVFTSIGMDQPGTVGGPGGGDGGAVTDDPRLVGVFRGESLAVGGPGRAYVNTQLVNVLNADGTFLSGAQSNMHMSDRDYNGNLKWTAHETSDGSVVTGRWSASRGVLTIVYDRGGRLVVAYGFEPDGTLAVRDAVTKKLINIYTRAR